MLTVYSPPPNILQGIWWFGDVISATGCLSGEECEKDFTYAVAQNLAGHLFFGEVCGPLEFSAETVCLGVHD